MPKAADFEILPAPGYPRIFFISLVSKGRWQLGVFNPDQPMLTDIVDVPLEFDGQSRVAMDDGIFIVNPSNVGGGEHSEKWRAADQAYFVPKPKQEPSTYKLFEATGRGYSRIDAYALVSPGWAAAIVFPSKKELAKREIIFLREPCASKATN